MKWYHLFLLFFLVPTLVFGLDQEKCTHIHNQVAPEWKRHNELIEQFKRLNFNDTERRIQLLKESVECCRRAIEHCDRILNDIAGKSYKKRKEAWRVQMKRLCEEDKKNLNAEIAAIQPVIYELEGHLAANKASIVYQKSIEKATLGNAKDRACQRRLYNIDEVMEVLYEVSKLYEEAASIASEARALIVPYPSLAQDQDTLRIVIENYHSLAAKYKKEAADWGVSVLAQKVALKEQVAILIEDSTLFAEKGLKRSCYELQKQATAILEQLIESSAGEEAESFKEELARLKAVISEFEKEADSNRLTDGTPLLTPEEFKAKEKEKKELFFTSDFLLNPDLYLCANLKNETLPRVVPLDGQTGKKGNDFALYCEQFYRFLVQSDSLVPELFIHVYENGQLLHIEKISLPFGNTKGWESYLKDGMLFIPETKLRMEYGLDLRLSFACDPTNKFSMIVAQKASESRYTFSISVTQETPLYACHLLTPPPWQLETLRKPGMTTPNQPIDRSLKPCLNITLQEQKEQLSLTMNFPVLDRLVEELKKDPLALAGYVHNEIALCDPYLYQKNGVFYAPSIHRNPAITYLEGQGSPWEQCLLLVYLLRKAGYEAVYAIGDSCSLPKDFFEKMLFTKLAEGQEEGLMKYPWVVFFDGKEWISLFPWMKEIQILEGHDLYNFMPEEYASASRWILHYLKGDEQILKHIGPDGDDTAGILFVRFVEENLRKQGLSLDAIGMHRLQLKKQFSSWDDFPYPSIQGQTQVFASLDKIPSLFAMATIEVCSQQNPQKFRSCTLSLARLSCGPSSLRFSTHEKDDFLHLQIAGENILTPLQLDASDQVVDIKIFCAVFLDTEVFTHEQTFHIAKGTTAALCSHFGGASPKLTSQFYDQFSLEKDEKKITALLAFVGAAYFERCSRAEKILANLHKVNPIATFAFGLSKLSPDTSKGTCCVGEELVLPQVDMYWFQAALASNSPPSVWHQELYTARMQCDSLFTVDASSNEHQILREVFKDQHALSTVKLLQLANQGQQKKGLEGEGFLSFTATSFAAADETPEAAQSLYFPLLKDLNLREIKAASPALWNILKELLDPNNPLSLWSCAYMTPGLILSQDGSYEEIGALILCPYMRYALISNNNLLHHGGLGSPLPSYYFTPLGMSEWQLIPLGNSYANSFGVQFPYQFSSPYTSSDITTSTTQSQAGTRQWSSDVRLEHKSFLNKVGDPVDVITGAFYIDEVDLALFGSFPIKIRRNYNSQNPLIGDLGCGWKLSLNPFLIEQDDKRFAAEQDGTVITYRYNPQNFHWEVFPDDNPDLCNYNESGIGSSANPFHAYIQDDVLYGTDGSKRFFEEGLLKKWMNAKGDVLTFSYENGCLSFIESSNGDFCGLHYNHEGQIFEIYAKDGRRISYNYNSQGDLVQVTLPNTAIITYEYDRAHRIIRETKPHGKVLENLYDDEGRVKEQRSPMGQQLEMITTASFDYGEGITTVTDGGGGKTTYKIFDKQIYKVIDPLGFSTLQSWFINRDSWFDPVTEQILKGEGGAIKSLKSTTDKRGLTTYYLYDGRGNPELIGLKGEDLTGSGEQIVIKKLRYNDLNLCVEEEVCGQKKVTSYDSTFHYLPKRVETYSANTLISYVDFEYNAQGQVTKEDNCGAITFWKYDPRGFPCQKTQKTGTEDPDVITTYIYNNQGQCIELNSIDGVQKNVYDLMGNQIESQVFSPAGRLLSALHIGYDLNGAPLWKQTAHAENIVYFDYHASGLIKATRQSLSPSHSVAYTLYDYDPRGYLIEETDPRGYSTFRDYDPLGRVISESKEGHCAAFSYEPGGLVETHTSPSGAQTTRHYTTNGLLKEEIYPDGTKDGVVYDFFGRPILETKNAIVWEIQYDDANHRMRRTHLETKNSEIYEFDAHGNLIRFTDAAGFTSEKTYDNLNRIKNETTPSGKQTVWRYHNNVVFCELPNGEMTTTHYEGGYAVKSEIADSQGNLLARSSSYFDPKNDYEEQTLGDETTITWKNALGLPIKIKKGNIITTHEYDACGNCIFSIDGDGRKMHQDFDGLGRLIQQELADGSIIHFDYDLDSNVIEYRLPNGNIWKASYDLMGRKCSEEVQAGKKSSGHWDFVYENGYLKKVTDPMQRTHTYLYDPYGRVAQDSVEGSRRVFTYDPRGFLATAEQIREDNSWFSGWFWESNSEHSLVEREYDADGNLSIESIYLNTNLIQQTRQTWNPSGRSLQIGNHQREYVYQNQRLAQVSTPNIALSYTYDLRGALKRKNNRLSTSIIEYQASGLPCNILTHLPEGSYQEFLDWYPSGKLHTYTAPAQHQRFTYNERGYLQSAGAEKYDFDFGSPGIGVRTEASHCYVPPKGLDDFGKILTSIVGKSLCATAYDALGQVICYNQKQLEWDPWGKLLKVTDPSFTWKASYDALGRRLQTSYMEGRNPAITTTSFYDPEKEFQEIGIQIGGKTFWKVYGPDACDALIDETGATVVLMHNGLGQLAAVISAQGTLYSEQFPTAYGPQETAPSIPTDLMACAQALSWRSKAQDPTGLIWMGARYYDPVSGRFLSPDPVSHPICLDLYVYANGDPINYCDPDGRFFSPIYQPINPLLIIGCNSLTSYCANKGFTRSGLFEVGSFDLPNGAIGFTNGINNRQDHFFESTGQLSQYGQGAKIYGTYNRTNSVPIDIIECALGHIGLHTPPVQLLKNKWNRLIATHDPEAKFFEVCHSGGADHVKNALLSSPEWVRQRIIVLAIAPSVIIPNDLCYKSNNYISRRDFVTHLDVVGKIKYGSELHVLEPHPNAKLWDHEFLSPTFAKVLKDHIGSYIEKYGGRK